MSEKRERDSTLCTCTSAVTCVKMCTFAHACACKSLKKQTCKITSPQSFSACVAWQQERKAPTSADLAMWLTIKGSMS